MKELKHEGVIMNNKALKVGLDDYWCHIHNEAEGYDSHFSLSSKKAKFDRMILEYILYAANLPNMIGSSVEEYFNRDTVPHAAVSVIGKLVDYLLPRVVEDSIGIFTNIEKVEHGDSLEITIKDKSLFAVNRKEESSKKGKRYNGIVTIIPQSKYIKTVAPIYNLLSGKESLTEFLIQIVQSFKMQIVSEVYGVMRCAMKNLPQDGMTRLSISGYSRKGLISLSEKVSAWNNNAKVCLLGTACGLSSVLPSDYKYSSMSFGKPIFIDTIDGVDIMRMPQLADYSNPFGLLLSDEELFLISPSVSKLVSLVFEGNIISDVSVSSGKDIFNREITLWLSYGTGVATNSVAGLIILEQGDKN